MVGRRWPGIILILVLLSGCAGKAGVVKEISDPEDVVDGITGVKIIIENSQQKQATFKLRAYGSGVEHISLETLTIDELFALEYNALDYVQNKEYAGKLLNSVEGDGSLEMDIVLPPNGENVFPVLFKKATEEKTSYVVELIYDGKVVDTKNLRI